MKLTILSVAFPFMPVSSASAGGSEQILHLLERALVAGGHRSFVVAAEGSRVAGTLIPSRPCPDEITRTAHAKAQQQHRRLIQDVLAAEQIDVIHFHGLDLHAYQPETTVPKLGTLHLPYSWYDPSTFKIPAIHFNCVSNHQARSVPKNLEPAVVTNGIATRCCETSRHGNGGYLLWIGRVCPEKGPHIALRIAHRLNMAAVIVGPVHPFRDHQNYFDREVAPLLDDARKYIGPIDCKEKCELLTNAKCLLIPSLAPETSSLVAMEALAAGTPVIAFSSGALPEIVEHERTGFVVDSEHEMSIAIGRVPEISPETCRSIARRRFDARQMAANYLRLYRQIIERAAVKRSA